MEDTHHQSTTHRAHTPHHTYTAHTTHSAHHTECSTAEDRGEGCEAREAASVRGQELRPPTPSISTTSTPSVPRTIAHVTVRLVRLLALQRFTHTPLLLCVHPLMCVLLVCCVGVVLLVWLCSPSPVYDDAHSSSLDAAPGAGDGAGGGDGGVEGDGGGRQQQQTGGGSAGAASKLKRSKGADLQSEMTLSFMEAVHGCSKTIQYTVDEACDSCRASGKSLGGKKKHCSACHGKGYVGVTLQGGMKRRMECELCQGEGRLSPVCGECKGSGVMKAQRQVEVRIPAGVNEATNVRLLHMGDAGRRGGKKGNLRIRIHVRPDVEGQRRRDGNDIHTDLHLSLASAVLGGAHTVHTVDGAEDVHLQPGVQHGQMMTLQGKGVQLVNSTTQQRGDHHIHLHVRIPQPHEMSEEQLQVLRQWIEQQRQQQQSAQKRSQPRTAAGSPGRAEGQALGDAAPDSPTGGAAAAAGREGGVEELTTSKATDSTKLSDKAKRKKLQQQQQQQQQQQAAAAAAAAKRRETKTQRGSGAAAERGDRRRQAQGDDEDEDEGEDEDDEDEMDDEEAGASGPSARSGEWERVEDDWEAEMEARMEEMEAQARQTSTRRRRQKHNPG